MGQISSPAKGELLPQAILLRRELLQLFKVKRRQCLKRVVQAELKISEHRKDVSTAVSGARPLAA